MPPPNIRFEVATPEDTHSIADLHAASWRTVYRDVLGEEFVRTCLLHNRLTLWTRRMLRNDSDRQVVFKAVDGSTMVAFACVLLDEEPEYGPLLDNLHVKPGYKGKGVGTELLQRCRQWVESIAPNGAMHLWVLSDNFRARRFYQYHGGTIAEHRTAQLVPGIDVEEVQYVWRVRRDYRRRRPQNNGGLDSLPIFVERHAEEIGHDS